MIKGNLQQYPLDASLGAGTHDRVSNTLRQANREYPLAPFILNHARTLRGQGASQEDALELILHLVVTIPDQARFTNAISALRSLAGTWSGSALIQLMEVAIRLRQPLDTLTSLAAHVPTNDYPAVEAFATIKNWNPLAKSALARAYKKDSGGVPPEDWARLASRLPANDHQSAAAIATIPNWKIESKESLCTLFSNDSGGLTGAQWATIASRVPANDFRSAATFAAIPKWNLASKDGLAIAFGTDPCGMAAIQWAALARRLGVNNYRAVADFASLAGWNARAKETLASAFHANPAGLTSQQYVSIASHLAPNDHQAAVLFATIPNWTGQAKEGIAAAFGQNPHGFTAAEWVSFRARVPLNDYERVARIAAFLEAGWPDTVKVDEAEYVLSVTNDGVMYQRIGVANPNFTLPSVLDGAPVAQWRTNREFQVRMAPGAENVYDYFEGDINYQGKVTRGPQEETARTLARKFWAEVRHW